MSRYLMIPVLASAFFIPSLATANTITVCASGCDYTSINAAIDASSNGDVIQLSAETYTEGAVIDTDGKAITLQGATDKGGNAASILDGGGSHRVLQCRNSETSATIFDNLVIQYGSDLIGGGMNNYLSSPTLTNCTFAGNSAFFSGGGMANVYDLSSPTLNNCTFTNNSSNFGGGMYNDGSSPTLNNCTFTNNSANFGGGIGNEFASNPTLTDCSFTGNTPDSILGDFTMVSAPCVEGDLDGDGDYDAEDARAAMVDFGIIEASSCPADINGDGEVGADDLGLLLSAWGVCVP